MLVIRKASVHHIFMLDRSYSYVTIRIFYGAFHCWLKKFCLILKKKKIVGSNCSHLKFHIPFRMEF